MRIIENTLARQLLLTFLVVTSMLVFLPAQVELFSVIEQISQGKYEQSFLWWHIVLSLPEILEDVLVLAFAIAVSMVLGRFWSTGEMLASFSIGIAEFRIQRVIIVVATSIVVLQSLLIVYLVPLAQSVYNQVLAQNQLRILLSNFPADNQLYEFGEGKLGLGFNAKTINTSSERIEARLKKLFFVAENDPNHYLFVTADDLVFSLCSSNCEKESSLQIEGITSQYFENNDQSKLLTNFGNFSTPFALPAISEFFSFQKSDQNIRLRSYRDLSVKEHLKLFGNANALLLIALLAISMTKTSIGGSIFSSLSRMVLITIGLITPAYVVIEIGFATLLDAVLATLLMQWLFVAVLFSQRSRILKNV